MASGSARATSCRPRPAGEDPDGWRRWFIRSAGPIASLSPRLAIALARWQHAAGPYWQYVCAAPFLRDGDPGPLTVPRRGAPAWLCELAQWATGDARAAIFLDLSPTNGLRAAPRMIGLGLFVVPVIQRWPAQPAVLSSRRLRQHLVAIGAMVQRPTVVRGVLFILDGDRAGPARLESSPCTGRVFDNRYAYPSCRFPPPGLLLHQGVTRAVWVSRGDVAADLLAYSESLKQAGLRLSSVMPGQPVAPSGASSPSHRAGTSDAWSDR